ncbi:hypothetical protein B5M09_001460, partial [Aphanomyces astaci]
PHVWRVGDRGSRALALRCGSIRTPAAFNGVTGIKATFMRIPELARTDPSMANVGPIAATVQDAAVAYDVLSGSHTDAMNSPLASVRIGVFPDEFVAAAADSAVLDQFRATVRELKKAWAT